MCLVCLVCVVCVVCVVGRGAGADIFDEIWYMLCYIVSNDLCLVPRLLVFWIEFMSCCWGLGLLMKYDKNDAVASVMHDVIILR